MMHGGTIEKHRVKVGKIKNPPHTTLGQCLAPTSCQYFLIGCWRFANVGKIAVHLIQLSANA